MFMVNTFFFHPYALLFPSDHGHYFVHPSMVTTLSIHPNLEVIIRKTYFILQLVFYLKNFVIIFLGEVTLEVLFFILGSSFPDLLCPWRVIT